jgi:hypothetical protein
MGRGLAGDSENLSFWRACRYPAGWLQKLVTSALLVNAECGFWSLARRAALDLASVQVRARKRRLADPELCFRGGNAAVRVADLCAKEAR